MVKPLPSRPSLSHLAKQAKRLCRQHQSEDVAAAQRIRLIHPRKTHLGVTEILASPFPLHDAQWVIAREYGFDSWPKLKQYVQSVSDPDSDDGRPPVHSHVRSQETLFAHITLPSSEVPLRQWLDARVDSLMRAHANREPGAAMAIRLAAPITQRPDDDQIFAEQLTSELAQLVIAKSYWFDNWEQVELAGDRTFDPHLEMAVHATVHGQIDRLRTLVEQRPELVRQRSPYGHRATLLHYVSANGVETWRQQTPNNIVEVTRLLLDAGADADAVCSSYGGGSNQTPLCWTVSSGHPFDAGFQAGIAEALLDGGARINGLDDDGMPIATALAFGYLTTAEVLAQRDARVDNLIIAAGLGRSDLVQALCNERGELAGDQSYHDPFGETIRQPQTLKDRSLILASKLGHRDVVQQLIDRGANVNAIQGNDETALHWAAHYGHLSVVRLLIDRGGRSSAADQRWKAKPIHWAAEGNQDEVIDYLASRTELSLLEAIELGLVQQTRSQLAQQSPNQPYPPGCAGVLIRVAAYHGHVELVRFLLESGANPNLPDEQGKTALGLAIQQHHDSIVQLLQQHGALLSVPVCPSCSWPMVSVDDQRGSDRQSWCSGCCQADGTRKSKDEIIHNLAQRMLSERSEWMGIPPAVNESEARIRAIKIVNRQPAWIENPPN